MRIQRNPVFAIVLFFSLFGTFLSVAHAAPTNTATANTAALSQSQTVNINTATADELAQKLSGIGASKAKAIVEYRAKIGKFVSIDQLAEVKGIGASTIEKNRSVLSLK